VCDQVSVVVTESLSSRVEKLEEVEISTRYEVAYCAECHDSGVGVVTLVAPLMGADKAGVAGGFVLTVVKLRALDHAPVPMLSVAFTLQ
jgi:hypothetical protein